MNNQKAIQLFNTEEIITDVELVIQKGLNKLLEEYMERHEILEKTHQQLLMLPSIVEELNKKRVNCRT